MNKAKQQGWQPLTWAAVTVNLSDLKPFDKNPRKISKEQAEKLRESLEQDGYHQRLIVTHDNLVIGGHQRLKVMQKMGLTTVEVLKPNRPLTDAEFKRINIRDNLQAGEWDMDALAAHFDTQDLVDWGFPENLLPNISDKNNEPQGDPDEAPELQEKPNTVLGDIYHIGPHVLVCGDSASAEVLAKCIQEGGGAMVDMVFTDPPYGMSYGGGRAVGKSDGTVKGFGVIKGDDARGDDLVGLVKNALATLISVAKKGASWYVCFPWRTYTEFEKAMPKEPRACIVWDKQSIGFGSSKSYRPQHEFIFYLEGGAWLGDKAQSDVWQCKRAPAVSYVHPTQKPIELIERALCNSSKKGDVVADVFGGSGTTMVAAHMGGRHCRMVELDPRYCDVIVKRMHKLFPDLEIKHNSKPIQWLKE